MKDPRDLILDELRSCVKRGLTLPRRPEPAELYDALGGDGAAALWVMLEFLEAEREVKQEYAKLPAAA